MYSTPKHDYIRALRKEGVNVPANPEKLLHENIDEFDVDVLRQAVGEKVTLVDVLEKRQKKSP